jgi:hypothetical protein
MPDIDMTNKVKRKTNDFTILDFDLIKITNLPADDPRLDDFRGMGIGLI